MTMRAVTIRQYGGPEVLDVRDDVDDPIVGPDSVLVQVAAASINPVDYKIVQGSLQGGFPSYLPMIPGWDVAGTVVSVGPAVTAVSEGQPVIGYARKDYLQHGTWAQRVAVPQRAVVAVPDDLDPVAASCLPLAGSTAWQCLDAVEVTTGDVVLLHSASGGVGHLAVQLAVARGARVIGSASASNADFLRDLGAEPVDHQGDLAAQVSALAPDGVDAVVDLHGADTLRASLPLLRTPSRFVTVTAADVAQERGGHYVFVHPDTGQLDAMADMLHAGSLRPMVSATYPLDEVRDAVKQATKGVRGKVVLTVPS